MQRLDPERLRAIVAAALAEDLGDRGDVTSAAVVPPELDAVARIVAREPLVVAGLPVAREVFRQLDPAIEFEALRDEGEAVAQGDVLAGLRGPARRLLEGERTALNFLMRMGGIARATAEAVAEVADTGARILDTRKTAPGLRPLDKYAVAAGGGVNHRLGLWDAVMIKDTHLDAGCTLEQAIARALAAGHPAEQVTAEVRDVEQLRRAIAAGAGRALLDNMDVTSLRAAVAAADGRIVLEASGGLRPGRLHAVASTGVDYISLGWLTHSARAADVALETEPLA